MATRLKYDTRVTILGHVQRGGRPSAFDIVLVNSIYLLVCSCNSRLICIGRPFVVFELEQKLNTSVDSLDVTLNCNDNKFTNQLSVPSPRVAIA